MDMNYVADWNNNVARLQGTYDATQEHDACGVGLVAALDGKKRRDVVEAGIEALARGVASRCGGC